MSKFSDLPKAYDASSVEDAIYAAWNESGAFKPDRNAKGEPYCIVMPPPNVTGVLHLGHALENALMDTMARFQRMRGKKVLLIPGTDHAAIATQAKVEKMLIAKGHANPRQEFGRENLVEEIRKFAEESKATILGQVKKMGTTCDWDHLAYTFDDQRNRAVKELFVRMHNDGLIYRGYRVVNWSVKGQSTCSDDEIEHVERPAKLYTFKYTKEFPITIATTRPETKLGDTAVAVHPADERYRALIGKTFTVDVGAANPLEIKIIADDGVDPNFGTGALGVTPAHSAVDFAMFEKQKAKGDPIALIPVIGVDGKMTKEAGTAFVGLGVEEARAKFVSHLRDNGLLEKEEDITQNVGTSDRYGDVIEAIPMTQWWLDVNKKIPSRNKSLRELMREAVTTGLNGDPKQKTTITPERFTKLYLDRVDNLRDWCLSRQLWWGHRIPAWYKGDEVVVSADAPAGEGWEQDPDTLDTWFSSGSWTFSTLGWPDESEELKAFHPTSWIQMGYEILYLWLMRMILMSSYALDQVPFKDAYIHGILRDKDGKKFSKSSGNGIDPIEVIKEYGCDALRISLLIGISPGNDSRYYTEKIEGGRNFVNKLWNISRFILMQIGDDEIPVADYTTSDKWIRARLQEVTDVVTRKIETHQFSAASEILRDFTWNEFADWYLEIAKIEKNKQQILLQVMRQLLILWHPFLPFVTEHIWKTSGSQKQLIVEPWPEIHRSYSLEDLEAVRLFEIISEMRRLRAEQGIEAAKQVEFALVTPPEMKALVTENLKVVSHLSRASSVVFVDAAQSGWVTTVFGGNTIALNVAGAVDVATERAKAEKEREAAWKYVESLNKQLANEDFTSKAPPSVVDGMKAKLAEAEAKLKALESKIRGLG